MRSTQFEQLDSQRGGGLSFLLKSLVAITAAYVLAFWVSFEIFMPMQAASFPAYESYANLFYLPHAVRLLVAWKFKRYALVLLVPGVMIEVAYLYGSDAAGIDFAVAYLTVLGPVAAFPIMARLGYDVRPGREKRITWYDLVPVGAVASLVGIAGPALVYGNDVVTLAAWFLGDVTGLLLVLVSAKIFFWSASRI